MITKTKSKCSDNNQNVSSSNNPAKLKKRLMNNYVKHSPSENIDNDVSKNRKRDMTVDYGYYSMPTTESDRNTLSSNGDDEQDMSDEDKLFESLDFTSSSSTSEFTILKPKLASESFFSDKTIKSNIESYLNDLQNAIQIYVRPCIVLEILSVHQSLDLYQNVEKLIPVTKFMLNVISTSCQNDKSPVLPNAESINIVFDSYITYLNGLPKAIHMLSELTRSNQKFISFLEVGVFRKSKLVFFLHILT